MLILHVGPNKTGSTYIQKMLFENRESLAVGDVYYPDFFLKYYGHHEFSRCITNNKFQSELEQGCEKLKSIDGDIILSSESFSRFTIYDLEKIQKIFISHEIKVVYYYRAPSARLVSWWQEAVKHGVVESFYEYSFPHVSNPFSSNILNSDLFLSKVMKVFGLNSISIVDYDSSNENCKMLFSFFKVTGLPALVKDESLNVNQMFDLREIEIIRMLNLKAMKDKLPLNSKIRTAYFTNKRKYKRVVDNLLGVIGDYQKEVKINTSFTDELMAKIMLQKYSSSILDGEVSISSTYASNLPKDFWMFNKSCIKSIDTIYKYILPHIKS